MTLTTFAPSNTKTRVAQHPEPRVRFSKRGMIRFNAVAVVSLGLRYGTRVQIHQDEINQWLMEIVQSDGFVIHSSPGDGGYFNSRVVAYQVMGSYDFEGQSMLMTIGREPIRENGRIFYELDYYNET